MNTFLVWIKLRSNFIVNFPSKSVKAFNFHAVHNYKFAMTQAIIQKSADIKRHVSSLNRSANFANAIYFSLSTQKSKVVRIKIYYPC